MNRKAQIIEALRGAVAGGKLRTAKAWGRMFDRAPCRIYDYAGRLGLKAAIAHPPRKPKTTVKVGADLHGNPRVTIPVRALGVKVGERLRVSVNPHGIILTRESHA